MAYDGSSQGRISSDPNDLLQRLNDNGITDLGGLAQRLVTENEARGGQDSFFLCTPNYCVVVRPEDDPLVAPGEVS